MQSLYGRAGANFLPGCKREGMPEMVRVGFPIRNGGYQLLTLPLMLTLRY